MVMGIVWSMVPVLPHSSTGRTAVFGTVCCRFESFWGSGRSGPAIDRDAMTPDAIDGNVGNQWLSTGVWSDWVLDVQSGSSQSMVGSFASLAQWIRAFASGVKGRGFEPRCLHPSSVG